MVTLEARETSIDVTIIVVPYIFQCVPDTGHAEQRDPDGAHGTQEVTELQGIVVHDAHYRHARLIAGMIELQTLRLI